MKKKIVFCVLAAIIAFVLSFAVVCPSMYRVTYEATGEAQAIVSASSGNAVSGGTIAEDGTITTDGGICLVEFPVNTGEIKSVEVNYATGSEYTLTFAIIGTMDGTFTDLEPVHANIAINDKSAVATLFPAEYKAIRVEFPKDCRLRDISLYNTLPEEKTINIEIASWRYVLVCIVTLFAMVAAFLIDLKFGLCDIILASLKENYKKVIKALIGAGASVTVGVVAEIIYRRIFGADGLGKTFNTASFAMFATIAAFIIILIMCRKSFAERPEKPLFFIIMAVGLFTIISQPMGHICWDIDSHYPWALEHSFFHIANYTDADLAIQYNSIISTNPSYADSEAAKNLLYLMGDAVTLQKRVVFSIGHLPAGLAIAVARLFGASFYIRFLCGQFANLLIYATAVYFGVRKLKRGKMILATIALFPTNIYIASNYTYDYWVTGFALLGAAYFVNELERPHEPYSVKDTVIMCAAFMFAAMPKQIFVILLLLPLFVRKHNVIKKNRRHYLIIVAVFFAITLLLFALRSVYTISGGGDTRGGNVNPTEQISVIFANPINYATILIKFLLEYLSIGSMKQYISNFAYLGFGSLSGVFIASLCFTALTDKSRESRFKGSIIGRIAAVFVLLGGAALAATSMYVAFTPVGNSAILGCQPRYIMPVLAPTLLTIANPGIPLLKGHKGIYNFVVLTVLSVALLYEIITVIAIPMM